MSTSDTSPNGRSPERETIATSKADKEQRRSNKRKALSPSPSEDKSSQSPKRSRISDDAREEDGIGTAKPLPAPKEPSTDRRESALQEERRRGKRLFGGLLNTLSQTTSSSQQKKRQEIERRQQARVHQQRAEDDKNREEKLAKLRSVRQLEQLKFDERVMQNKHANMLATARFLETKSTPKIYYLPWDLTEEQEDTIKEQTREAEDIIDKEALDFKQRKEQRLKALGVAVNPATSEPTKDTADENTNKEHPPNSPQSNDTNHRPPSRAGKVGHERESDRADDVVIEEVEDTVIY
ncbi:pinin/SDK/memA/ protein conserved region-domain-containing protein [Daldinia caldariorum]|uniref:pinin/SDK/memA/ protein conserved region-domain-containing protein n=1 Tax=Daldinia caldariorum TaxID=326644 RepID=UPI002007EF74|nr:pinin/SDK/memA/ protein conserved region-domain-containing protein [Daldinia caldariorum]KAI1464994.1 pinin/SDK/memA/ protein conserved region-domain-containing protein [Daldinia caldariorum]